MTTNVLAFAETRGGDLRRAALEAVAAARVIADARGGAVHAILFGAPGIGQHAARLGAHGADAVLVVEHAAFAQNNPEAVVATIAARMGGYGAFVCAASATGKDLAPRVAAKAGVPVASDATAMTLSGGAITVTHPGYTGKILQTLTLTATPAVVSVRPGAFLPKEQAKAGTVETVAPTGDQGSGILKSMSEANCFIVLGESVGNVEPGTVVEVQFLEGMV